VEDRVDAALLARRWDAPEVQASGRALDDLARRAVPPRQCATEWSGPWTTVRGLYRGRVISFAYGEACARDTKTSREAQAFGA
jgi:hypothetical protein